MKVHHILPRQLMAATSFWFLYGHVAYNLKGHEVHFQSIFGHKVCNRIHSVYSVCITHLLAHDTGAFSYLPLSTVYKL